MSRLLKALLQLMTRGYLASATPLVDDRGNELPQGGEQASARCYLVVPRRPWDRIAKELSILLPGQWWIGGSGVVWRCGSATTWVTRKEKLPDIEGARAIVTKLTGEEEPPYSVAACARALLRWCGLHQKHWKECEILRPYDEWHYYHCEPCLLSYGNLWDVKSCYYTILKMAPSPYVHIEGEEIRFFPPSDSELAKWLKLLDAVKDHKILRNSMVGVMHTSGGGTYYFAGKAYTSSPISGFLRPLANLVVISAYETCAKAVKESKARYSVTDCVVSEDDTAPKAWTDLGFTVSLKAQGETEIYSIGVYRVGSKETEWYKRGSRAEHQTLTEPTPAKWSNWMPEVKEGRLCL